MRQRINISRSIDEAHMPAASMVPEAAAGKSEPEPIISNRQINPTVVRSPRGPRFLLNPIARLSSVFDLFIADNDTSNTSGAETI